jgi:hypothetical protein
MILSRALKYCMAPLFATVFLYCKERSVIKEAEGFWIHADTLRGITHSLTVKDSLVSVDQFGIYPRQLALWAAHDTLEAHWPFDSWPIACDLLLKNDTLIWIYTSEEFYRSTDGETVKTMKFVRGDSIVLFPTLLFRDEWINIRVVPEEAKSVQGDSLVVRRLRLLTQMSIGPVREQGKKTVKRDSIAIQVDDVFIGLTDIALWLAIKQDLLPGEERDSLILKLNVDRHVPMEFLSRVRETIRKSHPQVRVARTTVDWERRKLIFKSFP